MTKNVLQCPNHATWQQVVESGAKPSDVDLHHLAECPLCQHAMEQSAADASMWNLAEETIKQGPGLRNQERMSSLSKGIVTGTHNFPVICDSRPPACSSPTGDWTDAALRDLLPPPRQPDFLSRLGRYDVERLIGYGGMGLVFRAHDSYLNRVVAIKVLAPHLSRMGAARQRFAREARAVAALIHPHIVSIHDVVPDGDPPFLVMQLVDGPSLHHIVETCGPLPIDQVIRLAVQLSEALSAAHEQGLIHRDVKPGNILLEADGQRALLTDFGLVRAIDDATLTHSGIIAGTPHYMSPEQARGEPIDARSDLFGLGAVLYYLCTGRPPFRASQPLAVLHRVCNEKHRPIRDIRRDVPSSLATVIDRLLAKHPSQRYANAGSLRAELLKIQVGDERIRSGSVRRFVLGHDPSYLRRIGWFIGVAVLLATAPFGVRSAWSLWFREKGNDVSFTTSSKSDVNPHRDFSADSSLKPLPQDSSLFNEFGDLQTLEEEIDKVRGQLTLMQLQTNGLPQDQSGQFDLQWQENIYRVRDEISAFEVRWNNE